MKFKILIAFFAVFLCSCVSNKPTFVYPSDINAMCFGARNEAHRRIETIGTKVSEKHDLHLYKHPGERKFGDNWAWYDNNWKAWVCGLFYSNYKIELACNPSTSGEINQEVNIHEHGHYYLYGNFGDMSHNPKYTSLFYNWRDPKGIKSCYGETKYGDKFTIDFIDFGTNAIPLP